MRIGNRDPMERVLIVAEIGNNHEGDAAVAEELIVRAAEAGADAVKFQTYRTEHYVSRGDRRRFDQLKSFELAPQELERLRERAASSEVLFLSTPFDLESVRRLEPLVAAYKIASGDNTFRPLLQAVAETGKPVIVSTGLADLEEIAAAKATIEAVWRKCRVRQELALLHCVSSYPVPADEANLAAIGTLRAAFGCTVGYSDHTLGIDAAALAVAAGARIVEKHFTIAKDHSGFRDHRLSADPRDLAELVRRIRAIERQLGDGRREPQPCERPLVTPLRRSLAVTRDLPAGAVLSRTDLTWVRPGGGYAPGEEALVEGRELAVPVAAGQIITRDALAKETVRV